MKIEDWRREEKGTTQDKMVGWHHQLNGREFAQAPGDGDGQGRLACCSPWGLQTVRHDWATEQLSRANKHSLRKAEMAVVEGPSTLLPDASTLCRPPIFPSHPQPPLPRRWETAGQSPRTFHQQGVGGRPLSPFHFLHLCGEPSWVFRSSVVSLSLGCFKCSLFSCSPRRCYESSTQAPRSPRTSSVHRPPASGGCFAPHDPVWVLLQRISQ